MTLVQVEQQQFQSPRSTAWSDGGGGSGSGSGSGGSPRHSSRGKSLDYDLRNAPSYHAAIMRLLPFHHNMQRTTTMHYVHRNPLMQSINAQNTNHPALIRPQHGAQRECLCDKERKQHYRKDWRPDDLCCNAERIISSATLEPPPHKSSSLNNNSRWMLSSQHHERHVLVGDDHLHRDHLLQAAQPNAVRDAASHHFKSCTVYLEVKLAEMLSPRKHALADTTAPDANRLIVCWQLLGELSEMKTPFAQVLSTIHQVLDKSIHSTYVAAKSGTPTFQRVPYFELVGKLESRKIDIEGDRESLKAEILARQAEIGWVEREIQDLKEKLKVAEGVERGTERKLTTILDAHETTITQVRTLQEEVLQLKRKMQRAKAEQARAHEIQCEQMIRQERHAKLEENYKFMAQELQEAQAELEAVRREAADSVPKRELGAAKAKVEELRKSLGEMQAKAALQTASAGQLTPRPLVQSWDDDEQLYPQAGAMIKSTAELLAEICKHNVSLTHNISRLQEDCVATQASIYERYHGAQDKIPIKDNQPNITPHLDPKSTPSKASKNDFTQASMDTKENNKGKKETKHGKKANEHVKKARKKN